MFTDGHLGLAGCPSFNHQLCAERGWTCVCNASLLAERMHEVSGFNCELGAPLQPLNFNLPGYVPTIYHGYLRIQRIDVEWVAIPLHRLMTLRLDGSLTFVAQDEESLRAHMCVHPKAKIIVTGPGPDKVLEHFWRLHRKARLLEKMKQLGIEAFTVPNFSFFLDAPPLHHRYNRSRILRVAERASAAGLQTILHLNIVHEEDWRDWERLFALHPEIKSVCMEFQTGYRSPVVGDRAFERLVTFQKNVGRSLHPILVGGARYAARLGKCFESATVIDAQPFMQTFYRKMCDISEDDHSRWNFRASKPGEVLDARFKGNLLTYSQRILGRMRGVPPNFQSEFPFDKGSSRRMTVACKQKPLAALPLFEPVQARPAPVSDQRPPMRSEPPTNTPVVTRISTVARPTQPKGAAGAIPSSLHRRNSPYKLRPNASEPVKTADGEAVD